MQKSAHFIALIRICLFTSLVNGFNDTSTRDYYLSDTLPERIILLKSMPFNNNQNEELYFDLKALNRSLPMSITLEVQISSPELFQIYLKKTAQSYLIPFNSFIDFHYLQEQLILDNILLIYLMKVSGSLQNPNNFDSFQNQTISVSIVIDNKQKICPFDCHGNGICLPSGICQCDGILSSKYHCQITIINTKLKENEIANIFYEPNTTKITHHIQWQYAKIFLENEYNELFKQGELFQQYFDKKPEEVMVSFSYTEGSYYGEVLLLQDQINKQFIPLKSQIIDEYYVSQYSIPFIQFQQIDTLNSYKSFAITLAYRSDIIVSFQYIYLLDDDFFEIFFLIPFFLSGLILLILDNYCHKNQNLPENSDQRTNANFVVIHKSVYQQLIIDTIPTIIYSLLRTVEEIENILSIKGISKSETSCSRYQFINCTYQSCAICLIEYQENDICKLTNCGHLFHQQCLDQWLRIKTTCPIDRKLLIDFI